MTEYEEFLNEWSQTDRHVGKSFIRDGAIDDTSWANATCKVLFLLKEAYDKPTKDDPTPRGFDLRKVIRDEWKGPKGPTWKSAACLAYGVQQIMGHTPNRIPRMPAKEESNDLFRKALLASAFMNIKKSDGKVSSKDEEIGKIATIEADLLKLQINLLDPQIVICGSTWKHIEHFWAEKTNQFDRIWVVDGRIFIDFWHPAYRVPSQLKYYAMCALLVGFNATKK